MKRFHRKSNHAHVFSRRLFLSGLAGAVFAGSAKKAESARGSPIPFRPEYKRKFEEILIVYDQVRAPHYLNEILEILRCLPPKRRLLVLVSEKRKAEAEANLAVPGLKPQFITCKDADLWGDWGRDIFFPGRRNGRIVLFVPYTKTAATRGRLTRGYEVLRALADDTHDVVLVPLAFEGGNMACDLVEGKRILFVGTSILVESADFYRRWFGRTLDAESCTKLIKRFFAVDEVVPVGRFKGGKPLAQSSLFFHIDLACSIVGEGVAAIERFDLPARRSDVEKDVAPELRLEAELEKREGRSISEKALRKRIEETAFFEERRLKEAREELAAVRKIFRSLGYRVVDLPTDWRRVRRTQSYANVLVGEDRVVMPIFPRPGAGIVRRRYSKGRDVVEVISEPGRTDYAFDGWNLKNYRIYRSLFGDVRIVRDYFYLAGGNVHCVIGSLG